MSTIDMKEKQIEEMSCKNCIHYEVCMYVNAQAVECARAENCKLFRDTAGYRKQREGEWVQSKSKFGFGQSNCSQCGGYVDGYTSYRYCPHCGMKIKGVITECAEHLSYTT